MRFLRRWKFRILIFFAVIGPGFITANVDNDAGGIYTYSLAGARYGYSLLWTLIPITFVLIVVQEMSARMGAVTGKGLADLIREEFGLRLTFFMMLARRILARQAAGDGCQVLGAGRSHGGGLGLGRDRPGRWRTAGCHGRTGGPRKARQAQQGQAGQRQMGLRGSHGGCVSLRILMGRFKPNAAAS